MDVSKTLLDNYEKKKTIALKHQNDEWRRRDKKINSQDESILVIMCDDEFTSLHDWEMFITLQWIWTNKIRTPSLLAVN
jgi:hypothetical protein